MKSCVLNDEEKAIMADLEGLPEPEKIGILEDSLAEEPDFSGKRILRSLLSKLRQGQRPDVG